MVIEDLSQHWLEAYRKTCDDLKTATLKNAHLKSRIAKLREMGEFYGNKDIWETVKVDHYKEAITLDDCGYIDVNKIYTDAVRYGGKTARKALKVDDEMEGKVK